jgi:alpha-beta hydrolase superfamily lysophospholipase
MTKLVWYIHGANSTPNSFNWIRSNLPEHDIVPISYDHSVSIDIVIEDLVKRAQKETRPINIIAHSLGGVIAVRLAQEVAINKIVTLSSPFGGSNSANIIRWFAPSHLMNDITPQNKNYLLLKTNRPETPILSFVSSIGSVLGEETDGVVSVSSQKALPYATYVDVKINHFEVLLSPEILGRVEAFLF